MVQLFLQIILRSMNCIGVLHRPVRELILDFSRHNNSYSAIGTPLIQTRSCHQNPSPMLTDCACDSPVTLSSLSVGIGLGQMDNKY